MTGRKKSSNKAQVDAIGFSPPYAEAQEGGGIAKKGYQGAKHSETDLVGKRSYMPSNIGSEQNISNKPYGEVDAIVFSPPYSESLNESKNTGSNLKREERLIKRYHNPKEFMGGKARVCQLEDGMRYSFNEKNIGNLPHGETDKDLEVEEEENILFFEPTPGFKGFEQFFHPDSVTHPAKASLNMLRWIIENFTKLGDVVLDPMAGTFSTCIMASFLNRIGLGIDLEEKFVQMGEKNKKRFKTACEYWHKDRPDIICLQGDSRQLSKVLSKVDSIIFSPPFASVTIEADKSKEFWDKMSQKHGRRYLSTRKLWKEAKYSEEKNTKQIGNLPHGKIDTVVMSPPFSESDTAFHDLKNEWVAKKTRALEKVSKDPGNIASLRHGEIDTIITSPPYEKSLEGGSRHYKKGGGHFKIIDEKGLPTAYAYESEDGQIGNLQSETYLSAMLKVYRECWKVLKKGGLMVIIVKNFIRNKKIVRLDLDTIKLCEAAGFQLIKRFKCFLGQQSFWRIIYHQKYNKVPKIKYESILVFQKP